ncbi:MAG: hypothetical protein DRQ78_02615 [Epsilonproteobacteria bacterium]|nr:MAG: hypothetical protein DRQ78_02615 [Campylobacterota bacterium]
MKRSIYSIIVSIFLVFIGCTQAPALKTYSLAVPTVKAVQHSRYQKQSLKVMYPQSLRESISQKMNFSYSVNDRGVYQNAQWSNHVSKILQGTFVEIIENAKIFKAVLADTSTAEENYRLESNIFAFSHSVRGAASHAMVSIQFNLIDSHTGYLIKSKRFSYQEPTQTLDAKGYVLATNVIMRRLSRDLVEWLR